MTYPTFSFKSFALVQCSCGRYDNSLAHINKCPEFAGFMYELDSKRRAIAQGQIMRQKRLDYEEAQRLKEKL